MGQRFSEFPAPPCCGGLNRAATRVRHWGFGCPRKIREFCPCPSFFLWGRALPKNFGEHTRDIPPVVYFHEQTPEKLAVEVSEYIITGG